MNYTSADLVVDMSDSDSDSDFDALESISRAPSVRPQALPQNGLPSGHQNGHQSIHLNALQSSTQTGTSHLGSLEEQLYSKTGENAILRSKLTKVEQDCQSTINQLLRKHAEDEQNYKDQVGKFRKLYETERSLHMLLLGDYNLSIGSKRPAQPASQLDIPPKKQKPQLSKAPPAEFSDGFVVSKPPIPKSVSNALSAAVPAASEALASSHPVAAVAQANQSHDDPQLKELSQINTFLLNHTTSGFENLTIQVLFGVPHSVNKISSSVGHLLLNCTSLTQIVEQLLGLLEVPPYTSDLNTLYLSLLFDSQFLGLGLSDECLKETPLKLCEVLTLLLDKLNPLPAFDRLDAMTLINLENVRMFTYILYIMDVLLATDWVLEFPIELANRILECLHAPQVRARGFDLFAKFPRREFATESFLETHTEPGPVTMELTFGGLRDPKRLTAAELAQNAPPNSRFARLVPSLHDLAALKSKNAKRALRVYEYSLLASVRMAYSLLGATENARACDKHVLTLLQSSVDSFPFQSTLNLQHLVTKCCVFYLWRRKIAALKDSLQGTDLTDLFICLVKITYTLSDEPETKWAQELLRQLKPPSLDGILAQFE